MQFLSYSSFNHHFVWLCTSFPHNTICPRLLHCPDVRFLSTIVDFNCWRQCCKDNQTTFSFPQNLATCHGHIILVYVCFLGFRGVLPVFSTVLFLFLFSQISLHTCPVTWILPQSAFTPHLHSISFISLLSSQCFYCFAIHYPHLCVSASLHLHLIPSLVQFVFKSILFISYCWVICWVSIILLLLLFPVSAIVFPCTCRVRLFQPLILIYFIHSSSWHNCQQHRTGCMGI